jgi:magnesium transporter
MKIQCYRIAEQRNLETVETESALEMIHTGESALWMDIEASGKVAFDELLSRIELNPVMAQCCRDAGERPRAIPSKDAIYFELPVYTGENPSDTTSLSVLCLRNLMVTIHPKAIEALASLAKNLQSSAPLLPVSSISTLVCSLLIQQSERNLDRSFEARRRIDELDATMDRDPEMVTLEQILDEKATVRVLDAVNEENSVVYNVLGALSSAQLNLNELETYYQLALSNTQNLTRIIERHESRLNDLSQRYVTHMQDKTNQRLGLLTIISAIFLPLTLLAGIYGMNFDTMPELHFPYAYPVTLGAMAAIAFLMWRNFKRKGWMG